MRRAVSNLLHLMMKRTRPKTRAEPQTINVERTPSLTNGHGGNGHSANGHDANGRDI
jgi:hypothetical protein